VFLHGPSAHLVTTFTAAGCRHLTMEQFTTSLIPNSNLGYIHFPVTDMYISILFSNRDSLYVIYLKYVQLD